MSAPPPPPPTPKHLLRSHAAAVSVVHVSGDNERIYSGDAAGTVVVTSTRSLRALAAWRAHADGLLGVQETGGGAGRAGCIVTHGRDNKLHVWAGVHERGDENESGGSTSTSTSSSGTLGGSAALPGLPEPALRYSLDVNALNFCRFALLALPEEDARAEGRQALLAVPNLVESAYADVWTLPGKQRLHAAIGKAGESAPALLDGRRDVRNSTGIIMSMHLFSVPHPHAAGAGRARLRLLCGYENGSVTMWGYVREDREVSVEGVGWAALWSVRLHVESVMAMTVSADGAFALSVSADHLVVRYNLADAEGTDANEACTVFRTKHPGNGSVAIADDGRVCAVGGWDGRVRLYSTRTFKPLGTLAYHKKNCQSVAFAHPRQRTSRGSADEDEDEMTEEEQGERARWLVSGGQDSRVAVWSLMNFGKT